MGWNSGLSDGFWGAVSTNLGQVIGAVSGTTNHQADAQIAIANQNKNDQLGLLQGLLSNNKGNNTGNSTGNNPLTPKQSDNKLIILGVLILLIVIFSAMRSSK